MLLGFLSLSPLDAQQKNVVGVASSFDAIDPTIRKVWIPQQHLYREYAWKSWEYTNYARDHYQRYTAIDLEGERWYDLYGNYITRGWLIYDWNQEQGTPFGSDVIKQRQYASWFNRLMIGHDSQGQYHLAVTIADEIRSTLTPLTFSKPAFNGIQVDFLSDKYSITAIASRVNAPASGSTTGHSELTGFTDYTNLFGIRGVAQVGDFLKLGTTYINVHLGTTEGDFDLNRSFRGQLIKDQNREVVREITIRISDDSPAPDGTFRGAAFFSEQILTRRLDPEGEVIKEWGPEEIKPLRRGGIPQKGYWIAEGGETIELIYQIPFPHQVDRIGFDLVVSNDYRIDMTSNRQTNIERAPVFLTVARSKDNVHDNSNQQIVRFEYGLPTSREVYGFTLEAPDLWGTHITAEYAVSQLFRRYPNVNFTRHPLSKDEGEAFYLIARKYAFPFFGYGEVFSLDENYRTDMFIIGADKKTIDYANQRNNRFELVDDNDDQDRFPDWGRASQTRDGNGVFPGLDSNNDFRSDFNQNTNTRPDYDEPFLRYHVDPPEFLFGVDMDQNTVVDLFEDDELPDYPFQTDHRGYNFYVGAEVLPGVDFLVGHMREWLWSDDRRSRNTYALLTAQKDYPRLGRLEVFNHFKIVKDNLPDDQLIWRDLPGKEEGVIDEFQDPLPAQDTIINTAFVGFDYTGIPGLNVGNSVKYDTYVQRADSISRLSAIGAPPDTLESAHFFGVINKVDYTWSFDSKLVVQPRFKSIFRWRDPFHKDSNIWWDQKMKNFTEMFLLMAKAPLMRHLWLEQGTEFVIFRDLLDSDKNFHETIISAQFSLSHAYTGYQLTVNIGAQWDRMVLDRRTTTGGQTFITVFAGLE